VKEFYNKFVKKGKTYALERDFMAYYQNLAIDQPSECWKHLGNLDFDYRLDYWGSYFSGIRKGG